MVKSKLSCICGRDETVTIYPECRFAGAKVLEGTDEETHECNHQRGNNELCCSHHILPITRPLGTDEKLKGKDICHKATHYEDCLKCEDIGDCQEADEWRVAAEEDAWERDHEYLDPHPRSEED